MQNHSSRSWTNNRSRFKVFLLHSDAQFDPTDGSSQPCVHDHVSGRIYICVNYQSQSDGESLLLSAEMTQLYSTNIKREALQERITKGNKYLNKSCKIPGRFQGEAAVLLN